MIALLLGLALAGPPVTDELVYTVVDEIYGRSIPREGVCISRPPPIEELGVDFVVVGVKRGARGCTSIGAMVDGSFAKPEAAPARAFADARWSSASDATRLDWLQAWTTSVVHAFDQFDIDDSRPKSRRSGDRVEVETTTWRRSDDRLVSDHVRERFTYGPDRSLIDRSDERIGRSQVAFTTNEIRLDGASGAAIHEALQQQGRTIARCVEHAWQSDLRVEGRTRIQWTLSGGRATNLGIVASDDDGSGLAECYARAVARVDFPPSMSGTVVWAFNLAQKSLD